MSWTDDPIGGNGAPGPGEGSGPNGSGNPTNNPAPVDAVVVEYGRVLDLLSEGPISGLVDGLKSVYLDETPIQNSDGTFNFKGLNVVGVKGTNTQSFLPGFPSVESEASVNTQVTTGAPVVRTISTTGATAARVKIRIPALQNINASSGQASGTSVNIAIDVQNNGGGFVTQVLANGGVVGGQFDTPFTRAFRVSLPGTGPWDIRVRRITADSGSAYLQNDTYFDSLTAIVDSKLRYPNSAVFGVVVDAKQFRSIPSRAYEIKGRIISVPTNYDPVARTYATTGPGTTGGLWDGTFKQAWTNNPAWIWYDVATNSRFGAGAFLDASKVDKYALYTIAQNCDALVSDGKGGNEPRFTCNTYIQTRQEGIQLLNDLASVFRGMTYWAGGTVVPVQDVDASPSALFTAANVEDGVFTYSGTALKARHTAAMVTWNDPNNAYRQAKEYVEDAAGIARYGLNIAEITSFGCTSQAQARRAGVHLITSELTQPETVVFRTGLEGIDVTPGEVILVQDQFRAATRFGGRCASGATTTVVPLDSSVTLAPATSYQLSVAMPDGTVATRAISTGAGTVSSLTLGSALPSAPAAGTVWVVSQVGAMSLWRVVSISEVEAAKYEVTALAHNPSKYASIDSTTVTPTTPSPTPTQLAPVTGLSATSTLQVMKDQLRATLKASWTAAANATGYTAECSEDYKPWVRMEVSGLSAQAWVAPGSTYRIRVLATYENGVSPFVEVTCLVPTPSSSAGDVNAINSIDYLSNQDKIQLRNDWDAEQQIKTQLDAQASSLGVSATAYDNAVAYLSTILTTAGAPSNWATTWPDGTTFGPSGGILTTIRNQWASIASNRATLQKVCSDTVKNNAAYADALARSTYNLVKNPSCKDTAAPAGTPEAAFLRNLGATYSAAIGTPTAPNGWSRWIETAGSGVAVYNYVTSAIPCSGGDQFRLEAYATKIIDSSGTAYLGLEFKAVSGTTSTQYVTVPAPTTWAGAARLTLDGTAPASIGGSPVESVRVFIQITGGATYNGVAFNQFYMARKIGAGTLEADLGIFGVIRSGGGAGTGNYVPGTSSSAPVGFKVSGVPFTTTFLDGTSDAQCQAEFGGSINIAGRRASTIANNAVGGKVEWTTAGTYSWTCPEGVTEVEVTVMGAGGGGAGGSNGPDGGGGGGAGALVKFRVATTPGTAYTVVVGAGGSAGAAATAGGNGAASSFGAVSSPGGSGGQTRAGGDGATATATAGVYSSLTAAGGPGGSSISSGNGNPGGAIGTQNERIELGWYIPGAGGGSGGTNGSGGDGGACDARTADSAGLGSVNTSGGGGGGSSALASGGAGGDGSGPSAGTAGTKGSGGGGGAWKTLGSVASAGGKGGDGYVRVIW